MSPEALKEYDKLMERTEKGPINKEDDTVSVPLRDYPWIYLGGLLFDIHFFITGDITLKNLQERAALAEIAFIKEMRRRNDT